MLVNELFDVPQIARAQVAAIGEADLVEPELAVAIAVFDVDVRGLGAFVRIEVEPEGANTENRRHV